jgi:hypothetical protein
VATFINSYTTRGRSCVFELGFHPAVLHPRPAKSPSTTTATALARSPPPYTILTAKTPQRRLVDSSSRSRSARRTPTDASRPIVAAGATPSRRRWLERSLALPRPQQHSSPRHRYPLLEIAGGYPPGEELRRSYLTT